LLNCFKNQNFNSFDLKQKLFLKTVKMPSSISCVVLIFKLKR
jgi:hypothetical protein